MRPELDEIQYIEDYLFNKLSKEKREEFEIRLTNDPEFVQKLEVQRILINRIKHLSIKQSVAQVHKIYVPKPKLSSWFGKPGNIILSIFTIGIIVLTGYLLKNGSEKTNNTDKEQTIYLFQLPLKGIDVPYISKIFNTDSGVVLHYKSGSSIRIPANSFVDETGKAIKGIMELKFRELSNVSDIFIAGIPMSYQFGNIQTNLESAAISEVYAFKESKPIQIKQGAEIEIIQVSSTIDANYNLFQFRKENGNWKDKGKDKPADLVIEIEGNQDDAIIHKGLKIINKHYNQSNKESVNNLIDEQKKAIANKINKKRLIVLELSASISELDKIISIKPIDEELIRNEKIIDKAFVSVLQNFDAMETGIETRRRTYSIESLGLWNCGRIETNKRQILKPEYRLNDNKVEFESITLVVTEMRTVINYHSINKQKFAYYPEMGNTLITVFEGNRLAYSEKFNQLVLQKETGQYTFMMKVYPEVITNYFQAKKILDSFFNPKIKTHLSKF